MHKQLPLPIYCIYSYIISIWVNCTKLVHVPSARYTSKLRLIKQKTKPLETQNMAKSSYKEYAPSVKTSFCFPVNVSENIDTQIPKSLNFKKNLLFLSIL